MYQAEEFVEGEYDASAYPPIYGGVEMYPYGYGAPVDAVAVVQEEMRAPQSRIPEVVRNFLVYFHRQMVDKNVAELQNIYEQGYNRLSERFYKSSPWPDVELVEPLIGRDLVFQTLYKELYFRHIYAKLQPSLEQRFESYYNYCDLFNYILGDDEPFDLELPHQWLWDIIDEFIYQFQSFSQFRSKLKQRSEDEIAFFKANPMVWNVHSVLNVLYSLINKSKINEQLQHLDSPAVDGDEASSDRAVEERSLYKMLGYFSLVGLLRLHSLLGDYHEAIEAMQFVQLNKKTFAAGVPGCQVTTFYYLGFAYLMMRRYSEAILTFCNILLYIQRTKQLLEMKTMQYDSMMKQNEQMYHLLAIALTLSPQRIDESVHTLMRTKLGDKLDFLAQGDEKQFEEMFSFACPKFLSPVPPNFEERLNFNKEAYRQQLQLFLTEVKQQRILTEIRSYLKLYATLPISKLAAFMKKTEDEVRSFLMCFKHKMCSTKQHPAGKASGSSSQLSTDVDFYVNEDMIHIADTKVTRHFGDYFIRQIHKFEEMAHQYHADAARLRALKL
ncbi:eukaryotic translation initiation factor 3 subunit L-like [Oscarella lobularis]|uniref:eukaryotic translation initiation factor 3 subunit L-like n=1 Tax=Oscarella lobularis TaxID=121494 RepID=UPI00331388F9